MWKYKTELSKIHREYDEGNLTFFEYAEKIYMNIKNLRKTFNSLDLDLKDEIDEWLNDFGIIEEGKFTAWLDPEDIEELENRLNELYDIGDKEKRIWFGM